MKALHRRLRDNSGKYRIEKIYIFCSYTTAHADRNFVLNVLFPLQPALCMHFPTPLGENQVRTLSQRAKIKFSPKRQPRTPLDCIPGTAGRFFRPTRRLRFAGANGSGHIKLSGRWHGNGALPNV